MDENHEPKDNAGDEKPEAERVLVVDDEPEVAKVLSRALTHAGYSVSTTYGSEDALKLLMEGGYALLVSDIHMPGMQGDELQRVAREADPDLAVILITAAGDVACAVECMRAGVFDYIIKPAPLADVVVRAGKALERRRMAIELRDYQTNLEQRVAHQSDRIRRLLLKSLQTLTNALEAKDENTRDHSVRVAELATILAKRLRPSETEFHSRIRLAGLIHDIGKIGVPESILKKPDRLTDEEFAVIKKHPVIGETILRPLLEGDEDILAVVRHHHERWDGRGYPDGLAGEDSPLAARIMAAADGFDAMSHARAYRQGMPLAKVLEIMRDGAGSQWDATVVQTLIAIATEGQLENSKTTEADQTALAASPLAPRDALSSSAASRGPVVQVRGLLDEAACEKLRGRAELLIERSSRKFVLDLAEAELGALGASLIHELSAWTHQRRIRMTIRNASPEALAHLEQAGSIRDLDIERSSLPRSLSQDEGRQKAA